MKEFFRKIWDLIKKIPAWMMRSMPGRFFFGCAIVLDLIGGTAIPLAYGCGDGWFFVPNLIVNGLLIWAFCLDLKRKKVK